MTLVPLLIVASTLAPVDEGGGDRELLRQVLGLLAERPMSEALVTAYEDLHDRAWRLGEVETAHATVDRVVAWFEEQNRGAPAALAERLFGVGQRLWRIGDYAPSLRLLQRAQALREEALGPDHVLVARTLINVANVHRDLGDFRAARPVLERALSIFEATFGPDDTNVAGTLNNLGKLLWDLGDYASARPLFERALAIREAAWGPDNPSVGESASNLAVILIELGELAAARPLMERGLAIVEARPDADDADVATALSNLANLLHDLGELDEARRRMERAIQISEAALGPDHPDVVGSVFNLGNIMRDLGDYGAAREHLERAIASGDAVLGPGHPNVVHKRTSLALLLLDLGDSAAALDTVEQVAAQRGQVSSTLASLTEGESHLYLAKHRESLNTLLSVAAARGDLDEAYGAVLDAKGQVARLTLQTREQIGDAFDDETLALAESLERAQGRLSQLVMTADVIDRAEHDAQIESLRAERDALDRALRRRAEVEVSASVTAEDVAAALRPGAAVVDLLVHPLYEGAHLEEGRPVREGRWSEPRVSAWIVRSGDDEVRHVDLGPSADIERVVAAFLAELVDRGDGEAGAGAARTKANGELRALVWEPLVAHLHRIDRVFLSPDGVLGTLPYEALRAASGRYLIEDFAFVYPGDVASWVERSASTEAPSGDGDALLSVGGVDFRERAARDAAGAPRRSPTPDVGSVDRVSRSPRAGRGNALRGSFTDQWAGLPATEYESRVVADLHADARRDAASSLLLQGAHATEERLKREMPNHRILHLATHGFFQPDGLPSMWEQALDSVAGERGMRMSETAERLTGHHPGLLSGLVLAGVNEPPGEDERRDDGYLTASEVLLLDLSRVQLVVLSACETGLGRPQAGEGLLGLRRAFHLAGADTVISSLWSVPDRSTAGLMQRFYRNLWDEGMGRHEALRTAQLEVLRRNRARYGDARPETWGAFVLSGDWR